MEDFREVFCLEQSTYSINDAHENLNDLVEKWAAKYSITARSLVQADLEQYLENVFSDTISMYRTHRGRVDTFVYKNRGIRNETKAF